MHVIVDGYDVYIDFIERCAGANVTDTNCAGYK